MILSRAYGDLLVEEEVSNKGTGGTDGELNNLLDHGVSSQLDEVGLTLGEGDDTPV